MRYYWIPANESEGGGSEGYEVLIREDSSGRHEVACITEPEDRTSNRDLSAVTAELNRLALLVPAPASQSKEE